LGLASDQELCRALAIPDLPGRFERHLQLGQPSLLLRRRIGEILLLPTEHLNEQRSDVCDGGVVVIEQRVEAFLMRTDIAVDDDATADQHRRRDDEPDRLDKTAPFVMRGNRRAGLRIGCHHPVAGHR
jgi:hypothetical protein